MANLATPPISDPMFDDIKSILRSKSWIIFFQNVASLLSATVGPKGDDGPANTLNIGTVTKGATASATITGGAPTQTLNLVLPAGDTGATGATGAKGDTGPTGSGGSDFLIMQVFGG